MHFGGIMEVQTIKAFIAVLEEIGYARGMGFKDLSVFNLAILGK